MPQRIRAGCDVTSKQLPFAKELCHSAFARVATIIFTSCSILRTSLPQRIRAGCDAYADIGGCHFRLCHSAFARVATLYRRSAGLATSTLPQRIRAGCDQNNRAVIVLNVALPQRIPAGCDADPLIRQYGLTLCHSAFVRVATLTQNTFWRISIFATAHSCGLRHRQQGLKLPDSIFATAHSCGLRL